VAWRYHKVQPGDTLAGIAKKYHTTERAISQVNGLKDNDLVEQTRIVIPVSVSEAEGRIRYSRYASRYKVHTGDTVLTVAEDFGVPPERLRAWNRLKGNELRRGRLLTIYKPLSPGEADKAPLHRRRKKSPHTVAKHKASPVPTTVAKGTLRATTP